MSGPAGSGKTTLVAGYLDSRKLPCLWYLMDQGDEDIAGFFYYMGLAAKKTSSREQKPLPLLTSEYLQNIPIFTKRYFENLCRRLKPPFVLVFDNYQEVSDSAGFHELFVHGLDVIPEGITVIILSRNEPLPQFARLRASKKVAFIGWNEIRFTLEESREVIRMGQGNLTDETLVELYAKTQGWPAGLVLILEGAKRTRIDLTVFGKQTLETIFEYFASEILAKTDNVTREFLLKTAFFPAMTQRMAEKLTGIRASEKILSKLYKSHYFIEMRAEENPVYHYHPLFREFLLSKAKAFFTHDDISRILRSAATLLAESGQIEHAALLFRDAEDWEGLAQLILNHAQSLTAQGRGKTLDEWLACLPGEIIANTPWLLYWMGICKIAFDPVESRTCLEQAFHAFKDQKDPVGLYLSIVGIINTFVYEYGDFSPLDHWISEMEALLLEYSEFPSPELEAWVTYGMFCALMYRQPQHPDIHLWEKRLNESILSSTDIRLKIAISSQLMFYYTWWTGELTKVAFLVKTLKSISQSRDTDPLSFIGWCSFEAAYYCMIASHKDCLKAVNEGLKVAEDTGIDIWSPLLLVDGAMINTTSGNLEQAQMFLDKMSAAIKPHAFDMTGMYHYTSTFVALLRGNLAGALDHAQASLTLALKSGVPFFIAVCSFALGKTLLEHGEREEGLAYLADARRIASSIKGNMVAYQSLISEALYFLQGNETGPGLDALAKAMAIGGQQKIVNYSAWQPSVMTFLYAKALEAGIETEYVRELIKKRELLPDASAIHVESWPWPVKIHAFGKFELIKHGKPVKFSGKIQKKPIELLKTLIAFGGREVSDVHLADMLWSDAEGDAAYRAFVTNLNRLRKLLGNKEAVQLLDGRLSLNPQYCWVDAWAFEHVVKIADDAWKEGETKKAIQLSEKAMALYRGPLLGEDFDESRIVSLRDPLREKFLRSLRLLGAHAEKAHDWEKAIAYYEQGLQSDDRAEEIYRSLMACYRKAGRNADVMAVYHRCRKMLDANFGSGPSVETEKVHQGLKKKNKS